MEFNSTRKELKVSWINARALPSCMHLPEARKPHSKKAAYDLSSLCSCGDYGGIEVTDGVVD